jgi:hypothetical protein
MKTFIKQAKEGQMISCPDKGIGKAKVVEVMRYADTLAGLHGEYLKAENVRLQNSLGDNYKDLYFECVVEIVEHTPNGEYSEEKIAVLDWREFGTCAILEV